MLISDPLFYIETNEKENRLAFFAAVLKDGLRFFDTFKSCPFQKDKVHLCSSIGS